MDVPGDHLLVGLLLLRGHDLPGGGFAAGLALAIGFILQYMARGNVRWVEDRLRILPVRWIGARAAARRGDRGGVAGSSAIRS